MLSKMVFILLAIIAIPTIAVADLITITSALVEAISIEDRNGVNQAYLDYKHTGLPAISNNESFSALFTGESGYSYTNDGFGNLAPHVSSFVDIVLPYAEDVIGSQFLHHTFPPSTGFLVGQAIGTLRMSFVANADLNFFLDYHGPSTFDRSDNFYEIKITDVTTSADVLDVHAIGAIGVYSALYGPLNGTLTSGHLYNFSQESRLYNNGEFRSKEDNSQLRLSALPTSAVPEPSSFALLGLGGIGLATSAYRRRRMAAF